MLKMQITVSATVQHYKSYAIQYVYNNESRSVFNFMSNFRISRFFTYHLDFYFYKRLAKLISVKNANTSVLVIAQIEFIDRIVLHFGIAKKQSQQDTLLSSNHRKHITHVNTTQLCS